MFEAWGDESGSVARLDPGAFVLAAVLAAPGDAPALREAMAGLRFPSERKIHWRADDDKRRRTVVETVARLPLEAVVVVRVSTGPEPQERRRRKCFERFAVELEAVGCTRLTLESRGPKDDRRDRAMLDAMRARRYVSGALRLHHAPGPSDPCLWIADAVCGAVVRARVGEPGFLATLASRVHLVEHVGS